MPPLTLSLAEWTPIFMEEEPDSHSIRVSMCVAAQGDGWKGACVNAWLTIDANATP